MKRALPFITLVLGLAIGSLIVWLSTDGAEKRTLPAAARPEATLDRSADAGEIAETEKPTGMGLQSESPDSSSPTGEDRPAPTHIEYPLAEKYAREKMSEVPHRIVGAWDENPKDSSNGNRRAFVVVVDPDISDSDLENLARDLRARHSDSEILSVRVYDSEAAARQPSEVDGGALAFAHLVAEVNRNVNVPVDTIRVRGRLIEP